MKNRGILSFLSLGLVALVTLAAVEGTMPLNRAFLQTNLNGNQKSITNVLLFVGSNAIANYFIGDGSLLTNLPGGSGSGTGIETNSGSGINNTFTNSTFWGPVIFNNANANVGIYGHFREGTGGRVKLGDDSNTNLSTTSYSSVLGGLNNATRSSYSTVVGGQNNTVEGSFLGDSVILGGVGNTVWGAIDMGWGFNSLTTPFSSRSVVLGDSLISSGSYNTLLGVSARSSNHLTFVWGGAGSTFYSVASSTFIINPTNGMGIKTNNPGTNALKVVGNVDSTVGFSINGVPLASTVTNIAASNITAGGTFNEINAFNLTNLQNQDLKIPLYTINKLENGKVAKVLWVGDSLATSDFETLPLHAFATNMFARYGTNGWWGGGYNTLNGWLFQMFGSQHAAIANTPDTLWYQQLWLLTNGAAQRFYSMVGDGFVPTDRIGFTYLKTNSFANGTLTVKTIDRDGNTNTIDVIDCNSATRGIFSTNYSILADDYKIQIEATGAGVGVAYDTPGAWYTGFGGVRYGILAQGGLNNFLVMDTWIAALKEFQPDLLMVIDANDSTGIPSTLSMIRALQTNLPYMETVIVQMPVAIDDYLGNAQSLVNLNARKLFQSFAITNANTSYFDQYNALEAGTGFRTLTNNADGISIYYDSIHPSVNNPTLANVLGRRLYTQLGFQLPQLSAGDPAGLALTNNETRNVNFATNVNIVGQLSRWRTNWIPPDAISTYQTTRLSPDTGSRPNWPTNFLSGFQITTPGGTPFFTYTVPSDVTNMAITLQIGCAQTNEFKLAWQFGYYVVGPPGAALGTGNGGRVLGTLIATQVVNYATSQGSSNYTFNVTWPVTNAQKFLYVYPGYQATNTSAPLLIGGAWKTVFFSGE